jgi:ATP-dependent DNA helicase RecQ
MPTGAGKSLIYQFTTLQLDGITLVISPPIALMKDQVDALNRKGIPSTFINSAITISEQKERLTLVLQGKGNSKSRLDTIPFPDQKFASR